MIVLLRVLLLAAAAAAVAVAAAVGLRDRPDGDAGPRYACPMHPEVRAARAGECPICRMALEPLGHQAGATKMSGAEMSAAADLAAVDNVRKHNIVDFVHRRSLLPPMRELRGPAQLEDDGSIAALFYNDQVAALEDREEGSYSPTRAPEATVTVRRTTDSPIPWDRSSSWIRFRPVGARNAKGTSRSNLRAGEVGWVELAPRPRQVLTVAASAVLQSAAGPYVLAWVGSGFRFEKRPVEIAETFLKPGYAVVLSGLRVNERVVSRAAFFLDADRRLAERLDRVGGVAP